MEINLINLRTSINKAYLKVKPNRTQIEIFKKNITKLFDQIKVSESEEFHKNIISEFLKNTYYSPDYYINTKGRSDLVIHNGKDSNSTVGVLFEAKKPSNKSEMPTCENINTKAFHELILYYLRERISNKNIEIKHLVITNIFEWYIFNASDFEKLFANDRSIVKQFINFEEGRLAGTNTDFFYQNIAKPFCNNLESMISVTHFDLRDFESTIKNANREDDNKLIALYKILSPEHLLKLPFANDSNKLDKTFYNELLYIIGLEETKEGSKKLIGRKTEKNRNPGSLIENSITILKYEDCLSQLSKLSVFGNIKEEQLFNIALELVITWINRILFLKLLEGQLLRYNNGNKSYLFLNIERIHDYDELNKMFFQVLAVKETDRSDQIKQIFGNIPYLNSSLFEPSDLEHKTIRINSLENHSKLPALSNTVLKDKTGKKLTGEIDPLLYLFEFLDSYDFSSEGSEDIQEENKTLINASVLGLIFEKINGYKDGSFFTPGFITMSMCKESIRKTVIQKFNEAKDWKCETMSDVFNKVADINEANRIVDSIKICDPAVGSGHFLVSALNEIIAIKSELKILVDKEGKKLKEYTVEVINDELIITDEQSKFFEYSPKNRESQRVQETLFQEKQKIIENCLFGVDINPNSVKICRLRLWIELLKNAYYKSDLKYNELETLPNIDINIKCGNSLISRYSLDADIKTALKSSKWNVDNYKEAIMSYRNAQSKDEKRNMEQLIDKIKNDFETVVSKSDKRFLKLNKLKGELLSLTRQSSLFDMTKTQKAGWNLKMAKYSEEIKKYESEIEEINNNKIYENAFEWRLEFPEVLNNEGDFIGFDLIIGNPPYGDKFSLEEKNYIKQKYRSYLYKFDSYIYFIELGIDLLTRRGYLEYITPILWLTLDNCIPIRSILLNENDLQSVSIYGEHVFEEAVVSTCVFLTHKTKPLDNLRIVRNGTETKVVKSNWISKSDYKIETRLNFEKRLIIEKIKRNSIPLSEFGEIIQGITPYDTYKGQSREIIVNKVYHSSYKKDETYGKWLEGKNLSRYLLNWDDIWLSYGNWLAAPREKRFFEGERILFREIPGQGRRIQAAFTQEDYYYGHSISPFKPKERFIALTKYILGIVNSKLLSWYGGYILPNFGKEIFPKLNPNDLKELPIPQDFVNEEEIGQLVKQLITLKQSNPRADTELLENQLDSLVYKSFGLTSEEIQIIKSD